MIALQFRFSPDLIHVDVEQVEALGHGIGRHRLPQLLQLDEVVLQQLVRQLLRLFRRDHHLELILQNIFGISHHH
jgi:hypothetical protein